MSNPDPPPVTEPGEPREDTRSLRLLRWALHGVFYALLAIAVGPSVLAAANGTAPETAPHPVPVLALSVLLGAVYGAGTLWEHRRPVTGLRTGGWLVLVSGLWLAALILDRDFSYLAFPLFFLYLHVLPARWALPAVAAATAAVVMVQSEGPGGFTAAKAIGPTAGAAVAVLTAWGYAALYREGSERQRLIDDLVRTRDELSATQREAGRLAERQRLAREIHDTLAQGLSSIVLLARAAESGDEQTARAHLREVGRTASENLAEARRFVHALTPPALRDAPLPEALRRGAAGYPASATSPEVRFRLDGEPYGLPVEAEVALLRLTQEALANVARHARARQAAVTLGFLDGQVTLDVYDDGVGFAPDAEPDGDRQTFGLHGMRERIADLGGTLTVESAPGEGTAVAAVLPVRAARAPRAARPGAGTGSGDPASLTDPTDPTDPTGPAVSAPDVRPPQRAGRPAVAAAGACSGEPQ
ncbi:sensor histidine kinase [Streptomyces sp. H27-D2]|uniref:sensor histidine kinase n=1 Tax=Streptomyces sp. H27-D2 TaxID=3046304 RepID=UPI002DBFDF0B|nr:sensor histidine kinase [Streptomyces sp. H27-D2]MEC4020895.1 sensor histidine kinase [Streptomyces sp. H27-D2]